MAKISKEQWQEAKLLWEADPQMELQEVARRLGISKPAATQHAQRFGWRKLGSPVQREELAQAAADVLSSISGRQELVEQASTVLDLTVQTRVLVLNRHRSELAKWRQHFPVEAMAGDPVAARRGKLAAEALAITQRSECIAYGLISYTGAATDAPLAEVVDEPDKPVPRWQRLLEAFATGASIDEFTTPAGNGIKRLEVDPNNDD